MPDHNYFSNLIWQIADLLRGPYRPPQYERVMLPMTVLRRFDCVLAPMKGTVLAEFERRKGGRLEGDALDSNLNRAAGQRFHNHSPLDFASVEVGMSQTLTLSLRNVGSAPITLTGPSNGTGYSGLPWRFTWTPRANETGTYRWFFSDTQCKILEDRDPFFRSEPLGSKADGYLMSSYPPGTEIGIEHKYRWYVAADFPDGSRAESYYVWMLWFFFHHAFGPLGQDGPGMLLGR